MERIGRYEILRKLGSGGMGSVYKAVVPVIDKVVAVKVLDPFEAMEAVFGYERLKEIFVFEAVTMSSVHHSSVVDVWDFDEDSGGRPFFVMEFICNNLGTMIGESFQMEKTSRRIHPDKVLTYGREILEGLACLHHNRIVHRDMKPFNILITDEDRVKICDFGMALVDSLSFSGPDTMQVGSPFYAAPEQNRDPNGVDGRADLYSVAVLLYRMLTGEFPTMRSFSLSMVNPLYDSAWDHFFARALNWQPAARFQSAREMEEALAGLQLHWQRISGRLGERRKEDEEKGRGDSLRREPANVCGDRALKLFGLNQLHRPLLPQANRFLPPERGVVQDLGTGLFWDRAGSEYPLTWPEAEGYVESLNRARLGGREDWRLPTVNELASLLTDEKTWQAGAPPFHPRQRWLWSCDRHGKRDAWYVNTDMGYVEWQDIGCRNYVRGVSG